MSVSGGFSVRNIVKAATETVNNSATLQNDDEFLFTVTASSKYWFEMWLILTSVSVNADFKCGWTVPASATMFWGATSSAAGATWGTAGAAVSPGPLLTEGSSFAQGQAINTSGLYLTGIVIVSTTAGTVNFQWAQNTQTAEDTKVLANSYLRVSQIA